MRKDLVNRPRSDTEPTSRWRDTPRGSRFTLVTTVAAIASLTLLATAVLISRLADVPISSAMRDTVAVLDAPFYIGLTSNVGILMWNACMVICIFTALVLRSVRPTTSEHKFFVAGAAVSAWLMIDDGLLLHDQVFPDYLGIPGQASLAIGLVATAAFLFRFRKTIRASDYWILLLSLLSLCGSATVDLLHDLLLLEVLHTSAGGLEILIEDGLKLAGISLWLGYFVVTAHSALTDRRTGAAIL